MKRLAALLSILLLISTAALADSTIGNLQPGGLVQPGDFLPAARAGCITGGDCKVQLGTAASQFVGTSGATLGLLNTINTYSALQTFNSGDFTAADAVFTGGAVQLPSGTTGQRPGSPVNGMIRYNTSGTPGFEGYVSGAWGPISGSSGGGSPVGATGSLQVNGGSGVFAAYPGLTCASHKWINALDAAGTLTSDCVQPGFGDLSGVAANSQIPVPTTTGLGGILGLAGAVTHQVVQYIDTSGVQHLAQVAFSDLSGALSYGQMPNSGVTAGSYTAANITVNAEGIVTVAANGSGGGAVSSVTGTAGQITVSPTTGAAVVSLPSTISANLTLSGNDIHTAALKIDLNTIALPAAQTGTVLQLGNLDTVATRLESDAFGATAYFSGIRYDGTNASPTTLQSGDEIGGFNAWGYNGSSVIGPRAALRAYASQNWTTGANGTYMDLATTPNGGTTEAEVCRFENDGGVTCPATVTGGSKGAGTLNVSGGLYVNNVPVSGVSVTAGTPDIVVTPSPGTGTFTVGSTEIINAQTGTSYTINATDMGKTVTTSNAASIAVTLPVASTSGFGTGQSFSLINIGAGTATVTPTTSTINGNATLTLTTGQSAYIISNGVNYLAFAGASSGAGSGTVNSGTSGQLAYYASTGVAVSGLGVGTGLSISGGSLIATGGGGGQITLISTQTASNSATLQWTGLGSSYNSYLLDCNGIVPASNANGWELQFGEGVTPTWEVAGYRYSQVLVCSTCGAPGQIISNSAAAMFLTAAADVGNTAGYNVDSKAWIHNISSASLYKQIVSQASYLDSANLLASMSGSGTYTGDTNAITAIRVLFTTGNITSGQCSLYGLSP